jgi:hypothetical protein
MNASLPLRIEKEQLIGVSFAKGEVLQSSEAITSRTQSLQKACTLGNNYKGKVYIAFATNEGPREVYTTIWTVSNGHVSLKNGAHIPVESIYQVTF